MTTLSIINFMSCNFLSNFYNLWGVKFSFMIHYMTSNFVTKKWQAMDIIGHPFGPHLLLAWGPKASKLYAIPSCFCHLTCMS